MMRFEEGRSPELRNTSSLCKLKKAGKYAPLEPLEKMQPYQHRDFSPIVLTSDFSPQEGSGSLCYFKPVNL